MWRPLSKSRSATDSFRLCLDTPARDACGGFAVDAPSSAREVRYNTPMDRRVLYARGMGLIDVVVGTALMLVIFLALFGMLQLGTRLASDNKARTAALTLSLERIEYIRSLDYVDVGISGGDPSGSLASSESITLNGIAYTRTTSVVFVDDEKDGSGGSDSDGDPDDYKRVKVTVSWQGSAGARDTAVVSDIAPLQ